MNCFSRFVLESLLKLLTVITQVVAVGGEEGVGGASVEKYMYLILIIKVLWREAVGFCPEAQPLAPFNCIAILIFDKNICTTSVYP